VFLQGKLIYILPKNILSAPFFIHKYMAVSFNLDYFQAEINVIVFYPPLPSLDTSSKTGGAAQLLVS
jgi:hypothetical protein